MASITEAEFRRLVEGIIEDKESIIRHNPVGSRGEILLWMLLSCLVNYLSLDEVQTPCFNGRPDAGTYRDAIEHVLREHRTEEFDAGLMLDKLAQA